MDRKSSVQALGPIDREAGEFWVDNPFELAFSGKHNLSSFEQNKFFLSRRGRAFVDLSYESGANLDSDSRAVVVGDFDRDGDLDLLVTNTGGGPLRLFRNTIPREFHRVRLELKGTVSNRSGIGTRIIAECDGQKIIRDVFPFNAFSGQSPADVILGVGSAKQIDRLTLRWPTGQTQTITNVPVNCTLVITEGERTYQTRRLH